jgi:hypothetical protein
VSEIPRVGLASRLLIPRRRSWPTMQPYCGITSLSAVVRWTGSSCRPTFRNCSRWAGCQFLYWQKGFGIPSSAAFGKIGDAYVAEVPRSASRIAKSDLTVRRVYTSQHLGVTSNWVIGDFRSVEEKGCELRACLRRHRGAVQSRSI